MIMTVVQSAGVRQEKKEHCHFITIQNSECVGSKTKKNNLKARTTLYQKKILVVIDILQRKKKKSFFFLGFFSSSLESNFI